MMRLGISLQEGYLIILATLIVLQGAGTIYGLWALPRPKPFAVWPLPIRACAWGGG
jgi:hypothetical protein